MKKNWIRYGISGAAAGIVNGLFGAGGGMVLVPLLIKLGKIPDKQAFSSALSIILPISIVSIFVYWIRGTLPIEASLPYLIGGLIGGIGGGLLFRKVTANFLHKALGFIILWGGLRLVWI